LFPFDRHRSRASVLDDLQRVVLRTRTSLSRYGPLAGGAIGHGCSHGAGCGQTDSLADAAGRFSGGSLVGTDAPDSSFFLLLAYFFFLFLDAVLIVWTIVIVVGALSEAHEFALWKGFLLVLIGIPLIWVLFKYGLNIVLMPI